MIWDFIFKSVKTQGITAIAIVGLTIGVVVLFTVLIRFWKWSLKEGLIREERLHNIITNHLETSDNVLVKVSENLDKSTEQQTKMTELLIKINERTKRG